MNEVKLLLNLYYETLYERLLERTEDSLLIMETVLTEEIQQRGFDAITAEKVGAYIEACQAFWQERQEMYNPMGVQYTFEPTSRQEAFELEKQLDWYDSEEEFHRLCQAVRKYAQPDMTKKQMQVAVKEVIRQCGAYPNQSIIMGYLADPAVNKLPDYVVSVVIEKVLKS
jgi:hypothetical protein